MQKWHSFFSLHAYALVFFFLLLLVLLDRIILLQHFTFLYLDDDHSIFWFGAREFARGGFHEPYFFGQSYNTLFESLLAVPLLKAGIPYAVALSSVTSFIVLFPYVLLAVLLYRRKKEMQSLLILAIPLLLPLEFGMGTAISRGCVTGLFVAGFALLCLFSKSKNRFYRFGFFGILALYANPNAALVLFPAGVLLLLENFREKKMYWPATLEPQLDRRNWLLKEEAAKKYANILFAGFSEDQLTPQMKQKLRRISTKPLLFLLRNNTLPVEIILDSLGLPMRAH